MMPEEPTTPDGAELARRYFEALSRGDLDAVMNLYAPAAVLDTSVGRFVGKADVRRFLEEWGAGYEVFQNEAEQIDDLGSGVTFVVVVSRGRLEGSKGEVRFRFAAVSTSADGLIEWHRTRGYSDIDEARAAAERLAEERG